MHAMELFENIDAPIHRLSDEVTDRYGVQLAIKREDFVHPEIMGNKLRKLKYNIIDACKSYNPVLLSFGGAYSNHILALSAAGRIFTIPTIGIIRGDELAGAGLNPVLDVAQRNGMQLAFVSRMDYRRKTEPEFLQGLHDEYGDFTVIPEGGSNSLAVKGAAEIVADIDDEFDVIACACGTGGTLAGLISGVHQYRSGAGRVRGFAVLKGATFIRDAVQKLLAEHVYTDVEWDIESGYHFGGYARTSAALIDFMKWFEGRHAIELDYIYTGKMMYALYAQIKSGQIAAGSRVLAIHTGGTQTAALRHLR